MARSAVVAGEEKRMQVSTPMQPRHRRRCPQLGGGADVEELGGSDDEEELEGSAVREELMRQHQGGA
jgi:hypothetical protein